MPQNSSLLFLLAYFAMWSLSLTVYPLSEPHLGVVLGPVPGSSAEEEKVSAECQSCVKSTLCDLSSLRSI